MPKEARLFENVENGVIVLTTQRGAEVLKGRRDIRVLVAGEKDGRVDLRDGLQKLGSIGFNTIFLEGGSQLNGSMLDAGLIDRVAGFIAPVLLGGSTALSAIAGNGLDLVQNGLRLRDVGWTAMGTDLLIEGYLWKPGDSLTIPTTR
jgi:riboflavin biosynthesis pyrimidine reductase